MRMNFIGTVLFALLFAASCKRSETVEPNKDVEQLQQRFHGKYKIVSSIASQPVDLNRDGSASTNLLTELDFENSEVVIRINRASTFVQFWPEVYLSYGVPDSTIHYANQGVSWSFDFDQNIQQLILKTEDQPIDPVRFSMPISVLVKPGDEIEVTTHKQLYTTSGWKIIKVVSLYKRYTMVT